MYIDIVLIDSILFSPNLQKTLYNQSINQSINQSRNCIHAFILLICIEKSPIKYML